MAIELTILGQPPRKSNSRQVVTNRRTGKPMVIKSRKAREWARAALLQIPHSARQALGGPGDPLKISCWIWYKDNRSDLSIELIQDVLEQAEVIKNDRYIVEAHAYKRFSRSFPRVKIIIERAK